MCPEAPRPVSAVPKKGGRAAGRWVVRGLPARRASGVARPGGTRGHTESRHPEVYLRLQVSRSPGRWWPWLRGRSRSGGLCQGPVLVPMPGAPEDVRLGASDLAPQVPLPSPAPRPGPPSVRGPLPRSALQSRVPGTKHARQGVPLDLGLALTSHEFSVTLAKCSSGPVSPASHVLKPPWQHPLSLPLREQKQACPGESSGRHREKVHLNRSLGQWLLKRSLFF